MFLYLLQVVRNFKFVAAFKKFPKNSRKYQRFKTFKTFEWMLIKILLCDNMSYENIFDKVTGL